jgi:hypothetical protein
MYDIQERQKGDSVLEYEDILYNKNKEFGNIMQNREVYEAI